MNSWPHKHILTLANFSKEDFKIVIDLTYRLNLWAKSITILKSSFEKFARVRICL